MRRSAQHLFPTLLPALCAMTLSLSAEEAQIAPVTVAPVAPVVMSGTTVGQEALPVAAEPELSPEEQAIMKMNKEREMIAAQLGLEEERLRQELAASRLEITRLQAENELVTARQQKELAELNRKRERLAAEMGLQEDLRRQKNSVLVQEQESLMQEQQVQQARLAKELQEMKTEQERMAAQLAFDEEKLRRADFERRQVETERERLLADKQHGEALRQLELSTRNFAVTELQAEIAAHQARLDAEKIVTSNIDHAENPFADGVLTITDRRIALNGPIISGTAKWVTDRIHFYNNQDATKPIFIVIDTCPGGSVMQGYRIVKAIETSKAPVHVIVKSFAASMGAVITTLADHSYAYPNAVLLHHQMSAGIGGNMTQMAEQIEIMKKWEKRLMKPLAEKLGLEMEELRKQMYENSSDGDWAEFADDAQKLQWVEHIVHEIKEVGLRNKPEDDAPKPWYSRFFGESGENPEKVDESGNRYIQLPRLQPYDAYFIHNPDRYYR